MVANRYTLMLATLLLLSTLAVVATMSGCNQASSSAANSFQMSESTYGSDSVDSSSDLTNYKGELLDRSFDDIKFEMAQNQTFERSLLTPKIEELFGKRIRIRGYMFPTLKKRGLKQFVLVRDNLECCFGPGAALFDCILVTMKAGETAEFSTRPITVDGTFNYKVEDIEGMIVAIYSMEGEVVR